MKKFIMLVLIVKYKPIVAEDDEFTELKMEDWGVNFYIDVSNGSYNKLTD